MYERNAIILERYFDKIFGYNLKNNIKVNFNNYCELVEIQEKYKNITEEEEETIIDYDLIANKIREIQMKQQSLYKENTQYHQQRESIFDNIDEDVNSIQRKFDIVNQNIQEIESQIKENGSNFISAVAEFNEKSSTRSRCGTNRRTIEFEYNNMLNETLDNYRNIDVNIEQRAKKFIESDNVDTQEELKKIIQENGKKERIPFNEDAIYQAIKLSIDIQKRETDILINAYEKTNKLFAEIKSGKLKIDMHKKVIVDSKSKQEFLLAVKEYLVQFLDNERLASVNGENEYNQLMKEACKNLSDDLTQINNLYTLLIKEISKKATKKMYNEMYKIEYLDELKKKSEDFENQIKKLKLPVTIINPNYWRIEGMEKIYDIFGKCVTENYNRDLSEFIISNSGEEDGEEDADTSDYMEKKNVDIVNEQIKTNNQNTKSQIEDEQPETQKEEDKELNDVKREIDKKIDLILGLKKEDNFDDLDARENNEEYDEEIYNELDDFSADDENENWDIDEENIEDDSEENFDTEDENIDWDEDEVNIDNNDEWNEQQEDEYDSEQYDEENEEENENLEVSDDVDFIWNVNGDGKNDKDEFTNEKENYENRNNKENDDDEDDYDDDYQLQDADSENADYDIWGNNISKKNKSGKHKKENNKNNADWGDEFVNIASNQKEKKKKGFFNKFMK